MNDADMVAGLLSSWPRMAPEIVLVLFACAIYLGGCFRAQRSLWAGTALVGLLCSGLTAWLVKPDALAGPATDAAVFANPLLFDSLAHFIRLLALTGSMILVLLSWDEVGDRQAGDYYASLLIVSAGLALTGAANDLISLFIALEMISIPTYVMLYLPRHDDQSQEAALKYFMLSIFSSAILLFGFSYLYGLTGSTNLAVSLHTLYSVPDVRDVPALALVALITIVAGLGFKITAVPFHFYAPDVYQGTATVLAALLAYVPKVAGFVALLRVLGFVLPPGVALRGDHLLGMALTHQVPILLWFLAAITMFLGNVLALLQDNLKRLFAYSSVAHAGYMLVGLAAAPYLRKTALDGQTPGPDGIEALLFYLVAYGAMTIGVFAVLSALHTSKQPVENVEDLGGLSQSHPWTALLMTLFLFSLIGIPLTAGFTGKFLLFFGAMGVTTSSHVTLYRVLALIGMLNAAIGAWYYLRIIAVMYLRPAVKPLDVRPTPTAWATMALCAVLTVGLSVPPGSTWLLQRARQASNAPTTTAAGSVANAPEPR